MTLRQQAIKTCDDALRQFVRVRDSRSFVFTCFCCRAVFPKEYASVGHFRKRKNLSTRWDPKNCHLICMSCQDEGDKDNNINYAYWLNQTYGPGTAEELTRLSNTRANYTVQDIIDIANELVEETKKLNDHR